MNLKLVSLLGFAIAVLGIFFLVEKHYLFSKNPITIVIQVCSVAFMIWARITFGLRSFHATANTTQGELVTHGPYHWVRHPIYASIIYFVWASVIAYPFWETVAAVLLISGGLLVRMIIEEKFLMEAYEGYAAYAKQTKRIIPFLF